MPVARLIARIIGLLLLGVLAACTPARRVARHLAEAAGYAAAGKDQPAEIEYLGALQINPAQPEAMRGLALLYFDEGRLNRALPFLQRAAALTPQDVEVRRRLGQAMLATGRVDEARAEAWFVLRSRPDDEEALLLIADTVRQPADADAVRQHLDALPAPASAASLVARGILDFNQQRLNEAEKSFRAAAATAPQSSAVHAALARLHQARNDASAAETEFAAAARYAGKQSARRLQYARFKLQQGDLAGAESILADITSAAPDYVPAWTWRAELAAAQRDFGRSQELIRRVLARDAGQPDALLLGIRIELARGDLAAARQQVAAMARLYPQTGVVHYQRALIALAANELDSAADALRQAITLAPDHLDSILLLADIQIRRGEYTPAIAALGGVVQRQPDLVRARQLLADALRLSGDEDGAIAVFQQFADAYPKNPVSHWLAGLVLQNLSRLPEARRAYEHALAAGPDFLPALEQLVGLDLSDRKFDAARDRVAARLAATPRQGGLHLLQAQVCLARDDTAGAEAALHRAIELQPDLGAAYFLLARLQIGSKQPAKALASVQAIIERNPSDISALMMRASLQEQQSDFTGARDTYERIVTLRPRFGPALNNLAVLYADRLHDLDRAHDAAQKARSLLPGEPHATDTLGWILYQRGQYAWASTLLQESAAKLPAEPVIQYHLGLAHYMMGEEGPARDALSRALKLKTDFPGQEDARLRLAILDLPAQSPASAMTPDFERLTATRTNDPIALVRRAAVLEAAGQLPAAAAACEQARKLNPANLTVLLRSASLALRRHDPASAMELARAARKLSSDRAVTLALGRLAYGAADYAWAASLLGEASRQEPTDPGQLEEFANAAYRAGLTPDAEVAIRSAVNARPPGTASARRFQRMLTLAADPIAAAAARTEIEIALRDDPECTPALVAAAVAAETGSRNEARRRYQEIVQRYPDVAPAIRGLALLEAEEPAAAAQAIALGLRARSAFPNDVPLARALGKLFYRRADYRRAVPLLAEAAQAQPPDPESVYYLGLGQWRLNQRKQARQSLERALAIDPLSVHANEARRAMAQSD